MRKRSSVLVLVLAAAMGFGTADLADFARSTSRMHRYFEELKTAGASMNSLERLLISFVLSRTPDTAD